jgi:hypothetical protein
MSDDAAPAVAPAAAAAQTSAGLYSRHTVVGAAATAAARPERTRAQEANEDNWKEFFDGNVSRFLTSQVIQAQLQQDYRVDCLPPSLLVRHSYQLSFLVFVLQAEPQAACRL